MKTSILILGAMILLSGGLARADVQAQGLTDCEFEGYVGKERFECKVRLSGNCNDISGKLKERGTSSTQGTCSGFEVRCDGVTLTEGKSVCIGINTQANGDSGVAQFQYADGGTSCGYPAVKFDFPTPILSDTVDARLYLSGRKVLFGSCKIPFSGL